MLELFIICHWFQSKTIILPASATNMKEKVIGGWILGRDGVCRVDPKWKNCEETVLKNSSKGVVNTKKEMEPLASEGGELGKVYTGKPGVEKEMRKRAGLVEEVRPAVKKKNYGTLGPKGLRKNRGNYYVGLSTSEYFGGDQKEGWALVEKKVNQEGYGIFPKYFEPPSYQSKKTFQLVRQDLYTCYKLAGRSREEPKLCDFNPFPQDMPCKRQPLPRYIFYL